MHVKTAWTNVPPKGQRRITVPGMGLWVSVEKLVVLRNGEWIAHVKHKDGKKDIVDSREIPGWIPYPYHGSLKELPEFQGEGNVVEDWPDEGESVLRSWVERNCKFAAKSNMVAPPSNP